MTAVQVVPILMYHEVTPRPPAGFRTYAITPRAFAAQMRWLALAGYTPIGFDELFRLHAWGDAGVRRPVVITLDDGYRDCAEHAGPILQAHGFTATFFLVAGLMGRTSRWLEEERGPALPLMDWPHARELYEAGFSFGSHTMTHPHLTHLASAACRDELVASRQALEDGLGCVVRDLAYPFGDYDERVRELAAEAGYCSACSVRIGRSAPEDDRLALHRVPINGQDTLLDFVCRLRTGRPLAALLRGVGRRARRRLRRAEAAT